MNKERCLLLKEIVADLERTEGRLRKIWVEEERNYDQRTLATKETDQGVRSKEAIEQLEQASDSIEKACEAIRQVIESPDFWWYVAGVVTVYNRTQLHELGAKDPWIKRSLIMDKGLAEAIALAAPDAKRPLAIEVLIGTARQCQGIARQMPGRSVRRLVEIGLKVKGKWAGRILVSAG
jgi:hypothetical protein